MKRLKLNAPYNREEDILLRELSRELDVSWEEGGLPLTLCTCASGFTLTKTDEGAVIAYQNKTALARAFGLLAEHMEEPAVQLQQESRFDDLFAMVDNARDAVLTVDTIQKTCRILARMGYSTLLLYLEDMFIVEGEPYFGHMRGRFSASELRECDAYARSLGIELVPGVQTLAHLNGIFRWERYRSIQDCTDILLADDPATYAFLEAMLSTLSSVFSSRRINIGMDEAHLLGAGRYLQKKGYHERTQIMLCHLERVVELCRKYGLKPAMWSDMFFNLAS